MTEESFTLTRYGLNYILQNGSKTAYFGLDGAATAEDATATSPVQELTTNGAGRQLATNQSTSSGSTISCKLSSNYEFSGANSIKAIFIASSGSPGANMMGRGLLAEVKNVGSQDTMQIELDLYLTQVA